MTYSFSKIRELVNVKNIGEFKALLNQISPTFFDNRFEKTKSEYIKYLSRLFKQIDNDFHFVKILKQDTYTFQLRREEIVLKAHLDLLIEELPYEFIVKKAV